MERKRASACALAFSAAAENGREMSKRAPPCPPTCPGDTGLATRSAARGIDLVMERYQRARALAFADDGFVRASLLDCLHILAEHKTAFKEDTGLDICLPNFAAQDLFQRSDLGSGAGGSTREEVPTRFLSYA